jgi:hypothetical protein
MRGVETKTRTRPKFRLIYRPTYSQKDFERIAVAIGKSVADLVGHERVFEDAASSYRTYRRGQKRVPPSTTRKSMQQIANAAARLLRQLEIYDYRKAPDGPGDFTLLEALGSSEGATEDEILHAITAISRLVEIFDAIDSAQVLRCRAGSAADDAKRLTQLTSLRGRRGDYALNVWIAGMMSLYKVLTGNEPRVSLALSGDASGPFVRFLEAAAAPVEFEGEPLCLKAVRERVRAMAKTSDKK